MFLPARDKRQAVFAVLKDKKSISSVARELQVSRKAIYFWIKRYKAAPARTKKKAFESKYARGKAHPRAYRYQLKDKLLKEVVRNPSASVTSLAKKLKTGRHALYNLLSEFELTTKEDREAFKRLYSAPGRLTHDIKVSVARAVKDGRPVSHLAREHNISRKTIYKWLHRYDRDGRIDEKYVSGHNHHRAFSQDQINTILRGVVQTPEISIHNLAKTLGISSHGIHNVLKRYNLTYKDARLAYSRARKEEAILKPVPVGFFDRIRLVWEQFMPSLA
ncbi:MAG: helix-turn-helix domain-containing protein, partial [Patescibacteria group bacterium]